MDKYLLKPSEQPFKFSLSIQPVSDKQGKSTLYNLNAAIKADAVKL